MPFKDLSGRASCFGNRHQDMFGAQIIVLQMLSFFLCDREEVIDASGNADLPNPCTRNLWNPPQFLLKFPLQDARVHAQLVQKCLRESFRLANQCQGEVLDIYLLVSSSFCQPLRIRQGLLGLDCQPIKPNHDVSFQRSPVYNVARSTPKSREHQANISPPPRLS